MNFYVPAMSTEDIAKQYAITRDFIPPTGCHTEKGVMGNVELFKAAGLLKQEIKYSDLATNDYLPGKC